MHHYRRPDECPQTHQVYHEPLCSYVLQQLQHLARSMRRKRINSPIKEYAAIKEITSQTIEDTIERIEVGHAIQGTKRGKVIHIQWNLK